MGLGIAASLAAAGAEVIMPVRNRRKGESLPAYHKRVSHELDSDDEMMMGMRERGFSDRQIADRLARDGRVRYDQKSISTRIMRIRLAQA